jgi:DNA-binding transcriptional regulator/RsmH inhibitor MraZ
MRALKAASARVVVVKFRYRVALSKRYHELVAKVGIIQNLAMMQMATIKQFVSAKTYVSGSQKVCPA